MAQSNKAPLKKGAKAVQSAAGKVVEKVKSDSEDGSRRALIEQLFYDFNTSRARVYWTNFFRGIFFGVGSVIGGTLVVAIVVSILSLLTDVPGVFGDFIQYIVDIVRVRS